MIKQIRPSEFAAWLAAAPAGSNPVLLDVREPHELEIASVKPVGFTLLTIPMSEFAGRIRELSASQPIACLCHHGGRSQQVASYLVNNGFSQVANVAGGIHAWADELDNSIARY
jgi:rhodanese-related sulfurtransferase